MTNISEHAKMAAGQIDLTCIPTVHPPGFEGYWNRALALSYIQQAIDAATAEKDAEIKRLKNALRLIYGTFFEYCTKTEGFDAGCSRYRQMAFRALNKEVTDNA
jgi:hypothetical protein